MDSAATWQDLLDHPAEGDHIVQVYQDPEFLADAVAEYIAGGLRMGEAAVVIARREHRRLFRDRLGGAGAALRVLDAEETLAKFMSGGMPSWQCFNDTVGELISGLRLQYPAVRAYGEMVDVLWQRAERDAALRLEEYWNELAKRQSFSLFCAYRLDNLDGDGYGPLECICAAHSHFIPARDYAQLNQAVSEASKKVLDQPLAQMLATISESQRPGTQMPIGQATLFWPRRNMPRAAERILSETASLVRG